MAPIRLLFLNADPRPGAGCNISLLRVIAGLSSDAYELHVAAPGSSSWLDEAANLGCVLHAYQTNNWYFPTHVQLYRHLAGLRHRVFGLTEIIRANHIDIVYSNAEYLIEGALAAALSGRPHVWAQRVRYTADIDVLNHFPLGDNALAEFMYRFSDRIVVNSPSVRASFPAWMPAAKFELIESGIPAPAPRLTRDAARMALRAAAHIPESSLVVLSVGRISPEKQLETWLRAADRLQEHPLAQVMHFVHVGHDAVPEYRARLLDFVRTKRLGGRVHFLGWQSPESMPDIYQAADLFTHTSSNFEGFSRVCAEAMLAGVPTVSTRCGGPEDYIQHGISGFLCDVGDDAALAERIAAVLSDPRRAAAIGEQGRSTIRCRYDESELNARWDRLFRALAYEPNRAPHGAFDIEFGLNVLTHIGQIGLQSSRRSQPNFPTRLLRKIQKLLSREQ